MDEIRRALWEHIEGLPIVDTHEHLPIREDLRERPTDVLREYLIHYFNRDLVSAGLSPAALKTVIDPKLPLMDRWRIAEPYWEVARYTGYGRALDETARGLYGLPRIDGGTIEALDAQFQRTLGGGQYRRVLKERSKILTSIVDTDDLDVDGDYFSVAFQTNRLMFPLTHSDIVRLAEASGVRIHSFDRYLDAVEALLQRAADRGVRVLKCSLAYKRDLRFERETRADAEAEFNAILQNRHMPDWFDAAACPGVHFQNYIMHRILDFASRYNMTYQFHTGIQEGSGNLLEHARPTPLSRLFIEYPDVDFDLFHISYPYQHEAEVLAKNFPNVYLDMCWAHIVSPSMSIDTLYHWLHSVPANKISAFGGDYCFVDGVYGHQMMARRNVCEALARLASEGMPLERAREIAGQLLHQNAIRIFKLDRFQQK